MYLLIDSGNTHVKYMLSDGQTMGHVERISTTEFLNVLPAFADIQQVLLASVANDAFANAVSARCESNEIPCLILQSEAQAFGITNSYANYQTMGVDRWLAIVGAELLYPRKNLIIIDSGTATTVDILAANKQHLGGWIVPGIDLMANSLFTNTSKVFGEVADIDRLDFGKSTPDNVNMGVWGASLGVVTQAISVCENNGLTDMQLLFTGGYGDSINRAGQFHGVTISDLVFHGIKRYITC